MNSRDGQSDIEALRLTREESRAVLDHHLALLAELDAKAMWTVRTALILVSLLASATAVVGIDIMADRSPVVLAGFGLAVIGSFLSVGTGLGAYAVSTRQFGVGQSHREELVSNAYTERQWLRILFEEYDDWTQQMDRTNDETTRLLFWSQGLLGLAVAALVVATILFAIGL